MTNSDEKIGVLQAELHAPEVSGRLVRVVRVVSTRGVDVEERPEQRIFQEYRASPGRGKQRVHERVAAIRGARRVVTEADASIGRRRIPLLRVAHELVEIAVKNELHLVD